MTGLNSASLYIHIPFCIRRCSYCDFFSIKKTEYSKIFDDFSPFVYAVLKDICFLKKRYKIDFWETVYIGGGTPSLLSSQDIFTLSKNIVSSQNIAPLEFTAEANPEDISTEWLEAAMKGGINRLSIGIQTLSDEVLLKEKRRGSGKKTLSALDLIFSHWKGFLSLDFIAGLKNQTEKTILEDLKICLDYKPHHISLYELVTEKKLSQTEAENNAKIWEKGRKYLKQKDFVQYEISNFAYRGLHKSLHNMNYWDMKNYAGAGPGAVGSIFFENVSGQTAFSERLCGLKNVKTWFEKKERKDAFEYEIIFSDELIEENIMMAFRLTRGLDRKLFYKKFSCDIAMLIPKTIEKWFSKKLLDINEDFVFLTERGLLFLNRFLIEAFSELNY